VSEIGARRHGVGRLSERELEIFCLTGHGHVVKEIATRLALHPKTVYTYRERICAKLRLQSSAELLPAAIQHVMHEALQDARA